MFKFTRSLIVYFLLTIFSLFVFSSTAYAAGTKTVTSGQSATLNWSVTGASSCVPDTNYPSTAGDNVYNLWRGSGAGTSGSVNFPTVSSVGTYTFTCSTTGASDSTTLVVTTSSCPADTPYTESNSSSIAQYCAATGVTCPAGQQYVSSLSCHTGGVGTWTPYGNSCTGPNCTGCGCVPIPNPDLTAGSISPATTIQNSQTTFYSTISNTGTASTNATFFVLFQYATVSSGADAATLGTANTNILAGGTSRSVGYTHTPTGTGVYYLRACADKSSGSDVNGAIVESNENNNCGPWTQVTISAAASTDCTATTKSWLTNCSGPLSGVATGGSRTISSTASGYTGSATYTCSNTVWSGPTGATCTANASAINGSCSATHYGCASGTSGSNAFDGTTYTWQCVGSGGGSTASCSETPAAVPDPVTINVRATSPIKVTPSASFTFPFTYSISDGSTSGRCRLLDSGSAALTTYTAMTSPNSIAWTAPSTNGQYTYYVQCRKGTSSTIVDQDNVLVKVCPTGLIWSTVSNACVPPSDLTAGTVTPGAVSVGVTTTFYSRISNIGGGSTDGTFKNFMQYSVTNPDTDTNATIRDLNSTNMSTLVAGASATTTSSRRYTSAGTYYMRACADKDKGNDTGNIDESNENNNCGAWTPVCVGTAAQCPVAGPPQVINPLLTGNNTTPGNLSFSCLNSTTYSITRTEGASGIYPITNAAYTGPISSPVSVSGNYNLICSNGAQSDTVILAYNSAPAINNISLVATPATAKAGTMSTLSWIISSPNNSCALTASAVYTTGAGPDAGRNADATNLTTLLATPNKTDVNDPYGERPMNTALRVAAPGLSGKAVGKKSILLQYTTDFLLNCGSSTRKVRVQVTNENEG